MALAVPALGLSPLLVPVLIGLGAGGCSGPCSCPNSASDLKFPTELDVQLTATGDACPTQPFCVQHGDGGGCTEYNFALANAGTCSLTATAADGRHVSAEITATILYANTCCGTAYVPDKPISLSFDQDAAGG